MAVMFMTLYACFQAQMKPLLGRVARKRSSGQQVEGEDHSAARDGADKEKETAVLPSTQTEAARAQQSSAIDASVFYKSSTYPQNGPQATHFQMLSIEITYILFNNFNKIGLTSYNKFIM